MAKKAKKTKKVKKSKKFQSEPTPPARIEKNESGFADECCGEGCCDAKPASESVKKVIADEIAKFNDMFQTQADMFEKVWNNHTRKVQEIIEIMNEKFRKLIG